MKRFAFFIGALIMLLSAQTMQAKTYDLTISDYEAEFFEQDNDVYLLMHTVGDLITIRLDIIVETSQQFFTPGKTYTWTDMLHTFCYAYRGDEHREYKFSDASFTWHLDELGLEHIAGTATDSLGNIYHFNYDVNPYTPTDTVEMTFSNSLKLEHSGEWYFSGSEGDFDVLLTLFNEGSSPVGHYDAENIDLSYSYIDRPVEGGDKEIFFLHDATIDITEAGNDTLKIEAIVAALDSIVYRLHMFYLEPKPLVKETITSTDLYISTDYLYGMIGAFQVEATDDTHYLKLALTPMSEDLNIYDTYTISYNTPNIGFVANYPDAEANSHEVYEGTVTITRTEHGAVITGTLLCYNNVEYTLNLSYVAPEKTSDKSLYIDGLDAMIDQGAWRLSGYNADSTQFVSLIFNNFDIAGTYDVAHMSPLYSYIVTNIIWNAGKPESYSYYEMRDADLTVTLNETDSVVTATGTILAQNSFTRQDVPLFTVQLSTKATTQGMENVKPDSAATKRMRNGVLIIEKNGVQYNVVGNIIR